MLRTCFCVLNASQSQWILTVKLQAFQVNLMSSLLNKNSHLFVGTPRMYYIQLNIYFTNILKFHWNIHSVLCRLQRYDIVHSISYFHICLCVESKRFTCCCIILYPHQVLTKWHNKFIFVFQKAPNIYLTHEDFPHPGAWTVIPLLPM